MSEYAAEEQHLGAALVGSMQPALPKEIQDAIGMFVASDRSLMSSVARVLPHQAYPILCRSVRSGHEKAPSADLSPSLGGCAEYPVLRRSDDEDDKKDIEHRRSFIRSIDLYGSLDFEASVSGKGTCESCYDDNSKADEMSGWFKTDGSKLINLRVHLSAKPGTADQPPSWPYETQCTLLYKGIRAKNYIRDVKAPSKCGVSTFIIYTPAGTCPNIPDISGDHNDDERASESDQDDIEEMNPIAQWLMSGEVLIGTRHEAGTAASCDTALHESCYSSLIDAVSYLLMAEDGDETHSRISVFGATGTTGDITKRADQARDDVLRVLSTKWFVKDAHALVQLLDFHDITDRPDVEDVLQDGSVSVLAA